MLGFKRRKQLPKPLPEVAKLPEEVLKEDSQPMEASKVTISPDKTKYVPLSKDKLQKLRRKKIIEYVNERPHGVQIKMTEFQAIGNFTSPQTAHQFIKRMVKQGLLEQHPLEADKPFNGSYFVVPKKTRQIKPKREIIAGKDFPSVIPKNEPEEAKQIAPMIHAMTTDQIEKEAALFAWNNDLSDTKQLKDFIQYLKRS